MGDLIKQLVIKNNTIIIVNQYTPFKITTLKCIDYLSLNYPNLPLSTLILTRCCTIFNILLKYTSECYYWNTTIVFNKSVFKNWNIKQDRDDLLTIFYNLFNKNIEISCFVTDIPLKILLTEDEQYKFFLHYWSDQFNYDDLYKLLDDISIKLNFPLPYELIDKILLYAYTSYNKLKY